MIIRRKFLPRALPDVVATLFLSFFAPVTFWFEFFVVVPEFHAPGSLAYCLTFALAVFILVNVKTNMLAVMLCDTSIKENFGTKSWRMCSACETLAPPRSWHCQICKTCILKRDHHCIFTGCCIGHFNHRFFLMLATFVFIGSTYASVYNHIFIWYHHADEYANLVTILKIGMPLLMLSLVASPGNMYLVIYELNLIAACLSGFLIIYHLRIILNGGVVHEKNTRRYDLGWRRNIKLVLGEQWYFAWMLPFIKSELGHDGIHWQEILSDSTKNK